jgi:hypothetical protein
MKRAFLFQLMVLALLRSNAQTGIEGVYIEQYYCVSSQDLNDKHLIGDLEEGMCTYRIYLDLLPGYRFQAAYGTEKHPLVIKSNGLFYNHPEVGNTQPNLIPSRTLKNNVVLLDSWLTAGAAGENYLGVPRKFDNQGEIVFQKGFFKSTTKESNLSFQECDGMYYRQFPSVPTFYQMDDALKGLAAVSRTNTIELTNGAWACMGKGAVGVDSTGTNMVLIGQLTTKGNLEYSLNIMVGSPDGKSTKYVYDNAQDGEVALAFLKGNAEAFASKSVKKKKKNKKRN